MSDPMKSNNHIMNNIGAAFIIAIGIYAGLAQLGAHIAAGINDTDEKSTRFSLHESDGKILIIDQKNGEVWSIRPTGPVVIFQPSISGKNFISTGPDYPTATSDPVTPNR
jgi:hypothetical protein